MGYLRNVGRKSYLDLVLVSLSKAAKLSDMDREKLSKTYEALLAEITDTDSDE